MPTRPQDADAAKVTSRTLAHALRTRRFGRSLTQAELAEKLGISLEAYSRLERGQALPSFPTLLRVCEVLETTPDALLLSGEVLTDNPSQPRVRRKDDDRTDRRVQTATAQTAPEDMERIVDLLLRLNPADRAAVSALVEHLASRAGLLPTTGPTFKRSR